MVFTLYLHYFHELHGIYIIFTKNVPRKQGRAWQSSKFGGKADRIDRESDKKCESAEPVKPFFSNSALHCT